MSWWMAWMPTFGTDSRRQTKQYNSKCPLDHSFRLKKKVAALRMQFLVWMDAWTSWKAGWTGNGCSGPASPTGHVCYSVGWPFCCWQLPCWSFATRFWSSAFLGAQQQRQAVQQIHLHGGRRSAPRRSVKWLVWYSKRRVFKQNVWNCPNRFCFQFKFAYYCLFFYISAKFSPLFYVRK